MSVCSNRVQMMHNLQKYYPSAILAVLFVCLTTQVVGNDPETVKAIESAAANIEDKNFEGDGFLTQKLGEGAKHTTYYCSRNGLPIFIRKSPGGSDSGKDVIVLDADEGRLINYKARNIYVALIRRKDNNQNNEYFPTYAYVRDSMPSDGENTVTIGGKKRVIEFDNFELRDHRVNRAKDFGHTRCIESIFAPCKVDKVATYSTDDAIPPNETAHGDTEEDKKLKLNVNNFFFDMEETENSEKMVGEIINLLINKNFDMRGKSIPTSKMDPFLDTLNLIGKYMLGVNLKDKHQYSHLGFTTIRELLNETRNNGGLMNPSKFTSFKVLGPRVQARDKSGGLAGRFTGADYAEDYGSNEGTEAPQLLISVRIGRSANPEKNVQSGKANKSTQAKKANDSYDYSSKEYDSEDFNTEKPISIRLGRSNHQTIRSDNIAEINSDVAAAKTRRKRDAKTPAAPHNQVDFKTNADLFSHVGWTTMDYANSNLSKSSALRALPFIGFGHCPYKPFNIAEVEKLASAASATNFYLKLINMDCNQIVKDDIQNLIASNHLSYEDKTFSVPSTCPGLTTVKLSRKEADEFGRAFMFASFSKTIKHSYKEKPHSPDGKPIPGYSAILVKTALNAVDDVKKLAPIHVILTIRRLGATLVTGFIKILQDLYRFRNCKACDTAVETNGALVVLSAFHFITNDMPILGITTKKAYEMFEIYFKKNAAVMKGRLNNYLHAK